MKIIYERLRALCQWKSGVLQVSPLCGKLRETLASIRPSKEEIQEAKRQREALG